eukprot:scaffold151444_cov19-Tisochrysis_lutea.AAC.1
MQNNSCFRPTTRRACRTTCECLQKEENNCVGGGGPPYINSGRGDLRVPVNSRQPPSATQSERKGPLACELAPVTPTVIMLHAFYSSHAHASS